MSNGQGRLNKLWRHARRWFDKHAGRMIQISPYIVALSTGLATFLSAWIAVDISIGKAALVALCAATVVFSFGLVLRYYLNRVFLSSVLMREALNLVDASLAIYDENENLVQFNRTAFEYSARRGEKLWTGRSLTDILRSAASRRFDLADSEEADTWIQFVRARRHEAAENSETLVMESIEPLSDQFTEENRRRYMQLMLAKLPEGYVAEQRTDVTEVKLQELALAEREAELEASRDEAQASSRAKTEFLASMSHEIRTPMNAVIGMTDLLQRSSLDETQTRYANTVASSAKSLLNLINDILDFSKVEAGKTDLLLSPMNLKVLMEEVVAVLSVSAQAKGIALNLIYEQDLPEHMVGDETRLRQIVTNLGANAVKFTESGHVSIHVSGEQKGGDVYVNLAVEDTGIGISSDKKTAVFEIFQQADGASNRKYEGTGLGLAIASRLAGLMGAEIQLDSEVGVGSRFSLQLILPAAKDASSQLTADGQADDQTGIQIDGHNTDDQTDDQVDSQADSRASGELTGKFSSNPRILVVEDNPVNQMVISAMLENLGAAVSLADDGQEGADEFKRLQPDLVFMDLSMPLVDGLKSTAIIRNYEKTQAKPSIPIIALTANVMPEDKERCLQAGMDDFLPKPVTVEQVQTMLGRWLDRPDGKIAVGM